MQFNITKEQYSLLNTALVRYKELRALKAKRDGANRKENVRHISELIELLREQSKGQKGDII